MLGAAASIAAARDVFLALARAAARDVFLALAPERRAAVEAKRTNPSQMKTAVKLYKRAVELGSTDSMVQLGFFYEFGRKPARLDKQKALALYKKAADRGDPNGCFYYARTVCPDLTKYTLADAMRRDPKILEAAHYYKLAADQGGDTDGVAARECGICLQLVHDSRVWGTHFGAIRLFIRASWKGDRMAMKLLAAEARRSQMLEARKTPQKKPSPAKDDAADKAAALAAKLEAAGARREEALSARKTPRQILTQGDQEDKQRNLLQWLRVHGKAEGLEADLKWLRMLQFWFAALDEDGSGGISIAELEQSLTAIGLVRSHEELVNLVAEYDSDGTGNLGFREFVEVLVNVSETPSNPIARFFDATSSLGEPTELSWELQHDLCAAAGRATPASSAGLNCR